MKETLSILLLIAKEKIHFQLKAYSSEPIVDQPYEPYPSLPAISGSRPGSIASGLAHIADKSTTEQWMQKPPDVTES